MAEEQAQEDRFQYVRTLGQGGMGIVYEVIDRSRGARLALKTLRDLDGAALYRFKSEFRALADLQHPNLIQLYELLCDGDTWFFTMELVDNIGFGNYVRSRAPGRSKKSTADESLETKTRTMTPTPAPMPMARVCDDARLRVVLGQLTGALIALHDAGRLHRDVKPSNILVTESGRVVLCDFGLVAPVDQSQHTRTDAQISGTPSYMSPEQLMGEALTPASDWFSVGVVLYEALTGRKPFTSLVSRAGPPPPPPGSLVSDIPLDLEALCVDLMQPDPASRVMGPEILARLGLPRPVSAGPVAGGSFVGRRAEQELLLQALSTSRAGATVAWIRGASGIGKSALLAQFHADAERAGARVLAGRCYEHESTPYKGVDTVIDALSHELKRLPADEADALVPRRIKALSTLFPVLRRVDAVARPRSFALEPLDPVELRVRAFGALKELLYRLAESRPLVISIDDGQWGDVDSAALLEEILRVPDAPRFLLVIGCRDEAVESSGFLRALRACTRPHLDLSLGPLSADDAVHLLRDLPVGTAAEHVRAAILRDAGGNPFLLTAMGRYRQSGDGEASQTPLEDMLRMAIGELPEIARACFEAVSVAGRPITQDVLRRAVDRGDVVDAVQVLRARHLIRSSGIHANDVVELYHDRLRAIVVGQLAPTVMRDWHLALASALEVSAQPDHEAAALHLAAAGEPRRAAIHAHAAAEAAAAALAFDRAARLYQLALELDPPVDRDLSRLRAALATALANAGRGGEAARMFLAAAEHAYAADAVEYRGRAAAQFVRSGYIDEGLEAVRVLLAAVGIRSAATPRQALLSAAVGRLKIWFRGMEFRPVDPTQIAAEQLQRLDTFAAVTTALGMIDSLRAFDFQCRHMLLALQIGDSPRVARALAVEAVSRGTNTAASERRTAEQLLTRAKAMAAQIDEPAVTGFVRCAAGMARYQLGDVVAAFELAESATEILREQCTGVAWELDFSALYAAWSLYYLGEVGQLAERVPSFLRDARAREDRFGEVSMSTGLPNLAWLVRDDADGARRAADDAIVGWSQLSYHLQHYWHWLALCQIELYQRRGAQAWQQVRAGWPALRRSLFMRIAAVRIEARDLEARVALAAADADPALRSVALRTAARAAGALRREARPGARALATLLDAGLACGRGARDEAATLYGRAADELAASKLGLYAASARRRHGELVGGADGARIVAESEDWMGARGIVAPARMTDVFAPMPE